MRAMLCTAIASAAVLWLAPIASASPPLPASPSITPGAGIVAANSADTDASTCTAGFVGHASGGRPVMFAAGHCNRHGRVSMKYTETGAYETIGYFGRSVFTKGDDTNDDMGLIGLHSDIPIDAALHTPTGKRLVTGVTADVQRGQQLCFIGVRSTGQVCGPVESVAANKVVRFTAECQHGDSGAPVYLSNPDGSVTAVGVLVARESKTSVASLIAPWLQRWSVTLDGTTPRVAPVAHGR